MSFNANTAANIATNGSAIGDRFIYASSRFVQEVLEVSFFNPDFESLYTKASSLSWWDNVGTAAAGAGGAG